MAARMRLYHHPFSPNARRVVMTALHLGLPIELVSVDLAKGEQRQPHFLRMNPNGKVPVLEDGGFYLSESHAIMQYLADKMSGQTLYPDDLQARADVNRWMFWSAQHFQPATSILVWERLVKGLLGLGAPDPIEEQRGEKQVAELAEMLDAHLSGRLWLCGEGLTLADLAVAAPLGYTEAARLPVTELASLQAWFARVQQLDAWKKTAM